MYSHARLTRLSTVYAILTEVPAVYLFYDSSFWSGVFLIFIFAVSVWNGGGFYIEVFGRKYVIDSTFHARLFLFLRYLATQLNLNLSPLISVDLNANSKPFAKNLQKRLPHNLAPARPPVVRSVQRGNFQCPPPPRTHRSSSTPNCRAPSRARDPPLESIRIVIRRRASRRKRRNSKPRWIAVDSRGSLAV